ncbi:MAG: hypothetical protein ACE5NG_03290 [bacterium]
MNKRIYNLQVFLGLSLGLEAIYIILASFENLKAHIPVYLICYGVAFIIYWVAASLFFDFKSKNQVSENKRTDETSKSKRAIHWLPQFISKHKMQQSLSTKEVLTVGIIFGAIFRLTFLFSPPSLSDDIYRYIWDGRVASAGLNPYQYAPNAEELKTLRDSEIYPKINHKEICTIYPPVNQLTFKGISKLYSSVLAFKAVLLLFDFLTIYLLHLILRSLSISLNRLLIYVWNPLVIVEFAGSGHVDIEGIFFMMLALWLLTKKRAILATFSLTLSFLTKFLTVILLPLTILFKKRNMLMIVLIFIVFAAALYLPYADAGERLFTALFVYSSKWRFNDSIFAIIFSAIKSILPEDWVINLMIKPQGFAIEPATLASRRTDLALHISRFVVGVILFGMIIYYLKRFTKYLANEGGVWVLKLGLILLGTIFLLSPTVHPWYLCWLVPFLVIVPNRAWILLTGLVGLSYWALIDYAELGIWQENLCVKLVEYLPFYSLLVYDCIAHKFTQKRRAQQE